MAGCTRRAFLGRTVGAVAAGAFSASLPRVLKGQSQPAEAPVRLPPSRVALIHGDNRADNIHNALKLIEADIRKGLAGKQRVVIKPNLVVPGKALATTHADCIEAVLDFVSPLFKGEFVIAESPASARAMKGFDMAGYLRLQRKYSLRFVDIDVEPADVYHVSDHRHRPQPVRVSKYMTDPGSYVISPAVMKTHDRAVLTLSLKNIVVGSLKKDVGSVWGRPETGANDKFTSHGGPNNEAIHYNLFSLAKAARPHLAIIDGLTGMEGNGPVNGTAVDHKVAIASTDFLAADRLGTELMGIDFQKVGYLAFCARAGMGQADLSAMEVLGEPAARHKRQYRLHDNIETQYRWLAG